jgi:Ca-activated chloride channel family protein
VLITARRCLFVIVAYLACSAAWAEVVRVENPTGSITVRTVAGADKVEVWGSVASRLSRTDDVKLTAQPGLLLVQCVPADGAKVDLEVTAPQAADLEAVTDGGTIRVIGLIRGADLVTNSGDIRLEMPWELMRLRAVSERKPKEVTSPKLKDVRFESGAWVDSWIAYDSGPRGGIGSDSAAAGPQVRRAQGIRGQTGRADILVYPHPRYATYGEIRVSARAPGRFEIEDAPLPEDSWVRPIGDAAAILNKLPVTPAKEGGEARLVSLSLAVYDLQGRPVPGLKPEDFEVLEDGVAQEVTQAAAEALQFNLVLLLDWNSSRQEDRPAMREAALKFVDVARPQDQVAFYALENNLFEVLWPLTTDLKWVRQSVETLPEIRGATSLYSGIALSYAQEDLRHSEERTVLAVLSDGEEAVESGVPFEKLRSAVEKTNVLLYPILLPTRPGLRFTAGILSERLHELADSSGGRVFRAPSIRDMAPVYTQVAEELRSVYTIGYSPRNQNFDGKYRRIQVKLKRPDLILRVKPGYYAW